MGALWLLVFVVLRFSSALTPLITVSSDNGLRFSIVADADDTTVVEVHYNVNAPLAREAAGEWNFEIREKSQDGLWTHENTEVVLKDGDMVNYWISQIRNGVSHKILNGAWKFGAQNNSYIIDHSAAPRSPQVRATGQYRLVLEDYFGSLDQSKWEHEVSLYGGYNWEFQAYTPEAQNSYVRGNTLYLRPTLTADRFGEHFLRNGVWNMNAMYGRCTNDGNWGCQREGQYSLLNPVMSAKLRSRATIKYGRVEILAKMPKGDWLWPAIWLLPRYDKYGTWPRSGEIDIVETIGNKNYGGNGIWEMGTTLHWGVDAANNRFLMTTQKKRSSGASYADAFHKYVLDWTRDYIRVSVDDQMVMNVPTPSESFFRWGNQPGPNIWASGDRNAPFDNDFYLMLNVAVGGTTGYFPDGLHNDGGNPKPWWNGAPNAHELFWNAKDQWYWTWQGEDTAMQVKYVKMWQLD